MTGAVKHLSLAERATRRALKRKEYCRNHQDQIRANGAKWSANNPERRKVSRRKTYLKRREKIRVHVAKYYLSNKEEITAKAYFRKYGITIADRDAMFAAQGSQCAICSQKKAVWHTDHCHKTGVVRGVLCPKCNLMLRDARDNPKILATAIEYLSNTGSLS